MRQFLRGRYDADNGLHDRYKHGHVRRRVANMQQRDPNVDVRLQFPLWLRDFWLLSGALPRRVDEGIVPN